MPRIVLSPEAKQDLAVILAYTQQKWGINQREKYHDQLEDRFFYLADNPNTGRKNLNLRGKPYSYHEGRHVIFYQLTSAGIEIIRILHEKMDFERHL